MEKLLLENESIISRTDKDRVVLTTLRIRYQASKSNMTSIMLDAICSVEMKYYAWPVLWILSALCLIGAGAAINEEEAELAIGLLVAAAFFIILFVATRQHVIKITSAASSLQFIVRGMGTDKVLEFINKVEEARRKLLKF